MANLGPNAINPAVYSKLPYDPVKDFTAVTLTTLVPNILVVNPYLPAQTLKEIFALARAKPEQLSYGTGGYGSVESFVDGADEIDDRHPHHARAL